jgi:hypothetical protein
LRDVAFPRARAGGLLELERRDFEVVLRDFGDDLFFADFVFFRGRDVFTRAFFAAFATAFTFREALFTVFLAVDTTF